MYAHTKAQTMHHDYDTTFAFSLQEETEKGPATLTTESTIV